MSGSVINPPSRPVTVSLTTTLSPNRGKPVFIKTNSYLLRTLIPDDAGPRMLAWLTSAEMARGLNLEGLDFDLEKLRRFIAGFDNRRNYLIGIFLEGESNPIGFYTIDVDLRHKIGQITTGIGEAKFHGKGVLWATIDALLDHFYAERDLEKISARILSRNHRMLFNFKDTPRFKLEAHLRRECLAPDGQRHDILVFSSFKDESDKNGRGS